MSLCHCDMCNFDRRADFEARIRADEREACAQVAEDYDIIEQYDNPVGIAGNIAAAIRARGKLQP